MIEFLNNNAGVIAAIQTFITFALSILAIVVTIIVARIPYKKELIMDCYLDRDDQGRHSLGLNIYNSGNVPLYLRRVEIFKVGKKGNEKVPMDDASWFRGDGGESFLIPKMMYHYQFGAFKCVEDDEEKYDLVIVVVTEEKSFEKRMEWVLG